MEFYIALLLGTLIYLGISYIKIYKSPKFSIMAFAKFNLPVVILNLLIGVCLVWVKDDMVQVYPITKLSCIIIGCTGQAVWSKLIKIVFPKTTDNLIEYEHSKLKSKEDEYEI